jgi:hypothetical protein
LCTAAAAAAAVISNLRLKRVTCCWQQLCESGLQTLAFYFIFFKKQFSPFFSFGTNVKEFWLFKKKLNSNTHFIQ